MFWTKSFFALLVLTINAYAFGESVSCISQNGVEKVLEENGREWRFEISPRCVIEERLKAEKGSDRKAFLGLQFTTPELRPCDAKEGEGCYRMFVTPNTDLNPRILSASKKATSISGEIIKKTDSYELYVAGSYENNDSSGVYRYYPTEDDNFYVICSRGTEKCKVFGWMYGYDISYEISTPMYDFDEWVSINDSVVNFLEKVVE